MRQTPFALVLLSLSALAAPQHWLWERGYPQGNNLNGLAATVGSSGFVATAVGDFGSIVTYAGSTGWTVRSSGTQATLKAVAMPTATTVYAVGLSSTVLKSTDSGATWTALPCKGCVNLNAVAFRSPTVGVMAGNGGIFYTTDGGTTFLKGTALSTILVRLAFSPVAGSAVVFAIDANGVLFKSTDSGATWAQSLAAPAASSTYYGLSVLSDTQVFVSADKNRIFTNGAAGTSWTTQTIATGTAVYDVVDVSVTSASTGFAIARINFTAQPPNTQFKLFSYGGSAWTEVGIGTQKTDVWPQALWTSGQTIFIAGQGGMLFRSSNGGALLLNDGNATGQRYFDVVSVDATRQLAGGAEGAVSVGVSGIWTEYYCSGAGDFESVAAGGSASIAVANNGVICGASNSAMQTWAARTVPAGTKPQRTAAFLGGQSFVSGGDDGLVLLSTNNGVSFAAVDPDPALTGGIALLSVRPTPTPELWVGTAPSGTTVKLYKSASPGTAGYTDMSATMLPSPSSLTPLGDTVRDINWLDQNTGFMMVSATGGCAYGYSYLYRTVNGGDRWNEIAALPYCAACFGWKDVYALNANHVWVQGETCFGQVSSPDNGTTWNFTQEQVPTPLPLLGLGGAAKTGELWMVGNFGAVLHSHCGGTDTSTCTPDSNSCTDDTCRPSDGQCLSTVNLANTCDDHNPCTVTDHCAADAGCDSSPKVCDDGNACTKDVCQTSDGGCLSTVTVAATCDDGNLCTNGDKCLADAGCAGTAVTCTGSTECASVTCSPQTGQCATTNVGSGILCDDQLGCTSDDRCDGQGTCRGTSGCVAPKCQVASCNTDGTCHFTPVVGLVSCDDDDPCTTNDLCNQGVCKGSGQCVDGGSGAGGGAGSGGGTGTGGGLATGGGSAAGGGGGGGGGSELADAGPPQPVFHPGCGCSSGEGSLGGLLLALGAWVRRRR